MSNTPSFTVTLNDNNDGKSDSTNTPTNHGDAGDKSINYILRKNEALDKENKELREKLMELTNRLDEEENFNDKNDKRINEMKGLTKNLVESRLIMAKMMEDKDNISKNYNDNFTKNDILRKTNENFIMMLTIEISSIMLLLGFIHSYFMVTTIILILGMNYYFAIDTLVQNQNDIETNNNILYKNNDLLYKQIKTKNAELLKLKMQRFSK